MNPSSRLRAHRGGAFFKLILFLVILTGVVVTAWIFVLPQLLTSTLKKRTGFNVKVTSLQLNLFSGLLDMQGLVINNPDTFARPEFLDVRTVRVTADARSLFSDQPVINDAEIDVSTIALVRNSDGTLNASLFQERLFPSDEPVVDPKDPKAKPAEKKKTPKAKPQEFLIKRLSLKLGKIVISDHSARNVKSKEYDVAFSHVYENVTDPKQIAQPLIQKSFASVGAAIDGLVPGGIGSILGTATKSGTDFFKEIGKNPVDALKSLSDTLEEKQKP